MKSALLLERNEMGETLFRPIIEDYYSGLSNGNRAFQMRYYLSKGTVYYYISFPP
jgi:hypothetical protein